MMQVGVESRLCASCGPDDGNEPNAHSVCVACNFVAKRDADVIFVNA